MIGAADTIGELVVGGPDVGSSEPSGPNGGFGEEFGIMTGGDTGLIVGGVLGCLVGLYSGAVVLGLALGANVGLLVARAFVGNEVGA
jgi:hypothetical protein